MQHLRTLGLALVAVFYASLGWGASLPLQSGPQDLSQFQATINAFTQSMNAGVPGFGSLFAGKNYLDNGAMFVAQRGTGAIAGGTTSGCAVLSYSADRWCVDTNVSSGAGKSQVTTSTPSPPIGFQNSLKVWRDSGALLQPVCLMQEIETARFVQLQGKTVMFSANVQPLAANSATAALTVTLITGTGTDQGIGALRSAVGMTASPAITPVLTGLASNAFAAASASPSWVLGTTAVWSRIYSNPVAVPATATEGILAICNTPVGSGSGTTDGFAITGVMLEQSDPNQIAPSAFEVLPTGFDLSRAQRFFWQITDGANTVTYPAPCFVVTANTTVKCSYPLPTIMQAVPVTAISTATSFGVVATAGTAGTCTTLAATASSNTTQAIGLTCTTAATIALGSATPLIGGASAGTLNASADF